MGFDQEARKLGMAPFESLKRLKVFPDPRKFIAGLGPIC